jgi:hypothetical protein
MCKEKIVKINEWFDHTVVLYTGVILLAFIVYGWQIALGITIGAGGVCGDYYCASKLFNRKFKY